MTVLKKYFCIIMVAVIAVSSGLFAAEANWAGDDDMDYKIDDSYINEDIPLFAGLGVNLPEELLHEAGDMLNTQSFRIPSLINAKATDSKSSYADAVGGDVLIAAVDRASSGADWGKIDIGVRLSENNGSTWSKMNVILSMPVNIAPQAASDWHSSFIIDPSMVQANDGSVVMIFTMFPESKGLHEDNWLEQGSAYVEVDGRQYMALYAENSNVGNKGSIKTDGYAAYTIRESGWVYAPDGKKTQYYVPQLHDGEHNYATVGDMYYAVGAADYVTKAPPLVPQEPEEGDKEADIYVGNIYLSYEKPEFDADKPVFTQKNLVAPWQTDKDRYSAYETYETSPAPLRAKVTSYIWAMKSIDSGKTWQQPVDITSQFKTDNDGAFLGVCPGAGIMLKNQLSPSTINRIVFPLYKLGSATVIYSDDNGETWSRTDSEYIKNVDEVQCVELYNGTIMAFGRQKSLGKTPVSISLDGGDTWKKVKETGLISVKCQKSIIALPVDTGLSGSPITYPEGMEKGKQYLIASHPSGKFGKNSSRTDGVISLGVVNSDNSITWLYSREIKTAEKYEALGEYQNFFAYSCLAHLKNGNIGILYEAFPSGYLVFSQFNLAWILAGGEPVSAAGRTVPLIISLLAFSVLAVTGIVGFSIRKKRRLAAVDGETEYDFNDNNEYGDEYYYDENDIADDVYDYDEIGAEGDEDILIYNGKQSLSDDEELLFEKEVADTVFKTEHEENAAETEHDENAQKNEDEETAAESAVEEISFTPAAESGEDLDKIISEKINENLLMEEEADSGGILVSNTFHRNSELEKSDEVHDDIPIGVRNIGKAKSHNVSQKKHAKQNKASDLKKNSETANRKPR